MGAMDDDPDEKGLVKKKKLFACILKYILNHKTQF